MDEIGQILRETRETLGLTYDEVERTTRIRTRYLKAMEEGDLASLPSPVQARGFLHNYAEFLGLNPDEILLQYAEKLRPERRARKTDTGRATRPSVTVQRQGPRWLSTDLLVAVAVTLTVVAVLIWGGSRVFAAIGSEQEEARSEGLSVVGTAPPSVTPTGSPPPTQPAAAIPLDETTPLPEGTLPADLIGEGQSNAPVTVRILVEKRAWLQVFVDGQEVFNGRVGPGDILEHGGAEQVRLVTGNAGGLRVVYNGQDQGRLGQVGEVVTRLWNSGGVITPSPTPSETPSPTPETTETPIPTQTLLP